MQEDTNYSPKITGQNRVFKEPRFILEASLLIRLLCGYNSYGATNWCQSIGASGSLLTNTSQIPVKWGQLPGYSCNTLFLVLFYKDKL